MPGNRGPLGSLRTCHSTLQASTSLRINAVLKRAKLSRASFLNVLLNDFMITQTKALSSQNEFNPYFVDEQIKGNLYGLPKE